MLVQNIGEARTSRSWKIDVFVQRNYTYSTEADAIPAASWDPEDLLSLLAPRTTRGHFQTRLPALSRPCSTKVYTEMYLALDHFMLISLRRSTINTRPRPWTLSRVGRAVNTKFV